MAQNKNRKNRILEAQPVTRPSGGLQVFGWIALAWAAWVIHLYWMKFSWMSNPTPIPPLSTAPTQWNVFWLDLRALLLLGTSVLGAAALGSYAARLFKLTWISSLEEKVFAVGLGLGILGYLIFALGLLQLYRTPLFWGLWAIGLALAWKRWFYGRAEESVNTWAQRLNHWHSSHLSWWPQIAMLWLIIAVAVMMTFVPEIFYDAMVYHVGVPNWYLHEGGIKYYPAIHAQFPFLRQMLNVWGLALGGERLAKMMQASSILLIIATYHVLARRYSFPKTTLIAALALFTMPMVNMNLWTAGIDIGLTSFGVLAFLAWINGITDPTLRGRWLTLCGVFSGFCFASKYPGLIFVMCLCLTTLIWIACVEKNVKGAIFESCRIGLIALALTLPWLIKSWIFTGNPMYPYLYQFFPSRDLFPDRAISFAADAGTGAKHSLLPLLMTPWTQTFSEISSFTAPGVFLLGLLAFFSIPLFKKEARHPGFVAGAIFFGLYWCVTNAMTDRIRLGIPGIAVGCYLLAHPVGYFYQRGGKVLQMGIALLVAFGAFTGILSTYPTLTRSYVPWDVLAGRESAESYLSYTHPGMDPFPAMNLLAETKSIIPPGHRLLIVGDEKASLSPVPFMATGVFNNALIVQWASESKTVEDLVKKFTDHRISHMLVNVAETQRLSGYKILDFDDRSLALFNSFSDKHLRIVKQANIVERFFNQTSPLVLYEFKETPWTTPPSFNLISAIYQQWKNPKK